jgi:hypothetical protein
MTNEEIAKQIANSNEWMQRGDTVSIDLPALAARITAALSAAHQRGAAQERKRILAQIDDMTADMDPRDVAIAIRATAPAAVEAGESSADRRNRAG